MQPTITDIIKFIKSRPPEFFQLKKIHGRTTGFYKGDHIEIDYRKDLVQTILHECTHVLRPELSETKVIAHERALMKVIDNIQVAELLLIIGKKIKITELKQCYLKRQ